MHLGQRVELPNAASFAPHVAQRRSAAIGDSFSRSQSASKSLQAAESTAGNAGQLQFPEDWAAILTHNFELISELRRARATHLLSTKAKATQTLRSKCEPAERGQELINFNKA